MAVRAMGHLAASYLLEQEPELWHVVAVLDSGTVGGDFLKSHAKSNLSLVFDDIEQAHERRQLATKADISAALEFAKEKDQVLFTCHAGQGRSAPLAYLALCQRDDIADAVALLDPTRHRPNRRVIELGSVLLDNPDVLSQFISWRDRTSHIKFSDYYDEIEKEIDALEARGARNRITNEPEHAKYE